MSKTTIVTLVVFVVLGVGAFFMFNNPFKSPLGLVEDMAFGFMEDLQFKDFRSSSHYSHGLEQDRLDIGKSLETLFFVKPEMLDILDFRVVRTEFDRANENAKTVIKTRYKILNKDKKPRENDIVLYWQKRHPDCPQGGSCDAGVCKNESGNIIYEADEDSESDEPTNKDDAILDTKDNAAKATDKTYPCDPNAEFKWFLNVDSTLKRKDYRDPDTKK